MVYGKYLNDCTIYAVDFDGTLCENRYPGIGRPNMALIRWLIERRKAGDKVILWTNRVGEYLKRAVDQSGEWGLEFDAVNENIPEIMRKFARVLDGGPPSPKVTADIFIDDAACSHGLPFGGNDGTCRHIGACWREDCPRQCM